MAALAAYEFLRLIDADGRIAVVAAVGCWLVSLGTATSWMLLLLLILAVDVGRWLLARGAGRRVIVAGRTVLYVALPLGLLVATHERDGWRATLLLLATVVVSDSAQYYSGRMFGRHALAPTISPKKTIEGAVGGVVFGTLFMAVAGARVLPAIGMVRLVVLGAIVVVLGILGDLFESHMKRKVGVKDSSSVIPGHGGVLDRIDALLFASPAFYLYLRSMA